MLELADKLDPGLSKWRGELLFDLQSTSVILAQRALEENRITAQQAKVKLTMFSLVHYMLQLNFIFLGHLQ